MLIENKTKTSQLKTKKKRFKMSFNKPGALLYLWRLLILPRVQTSHSPAHILLANYKTLRGGSKFLHNTEIVYACKSVDRIQLIKKKYSPSSCTIVENRAVERNRDSSTESYLHSITEDGSSRLRRRCNSQASRYTVHGTLYGLPVSFHNIVTVYNVAFSRLK